MCPIPSPLWRSEITEYPSGDTDTYSQETALGDLVTKLYLSALSPPENGNTYSRCRLWVMLEPETYRSFSVRFKILELCVPLKIGSRLLGCTPLENIAVSGVCASLSLQEEAH